MNEIGDPRQPTRSLAPKHNVPQRSSGPIPFSPVQHTEASPSSPEPQFSTVPQGKVEQHESWVKRALHTVQSKFSRGDSHGAMGDLAQLGSPEKTSGLMHDHFNVMVKPISTEEEKKLIEDIKSVSTYQEAVKKLANNPQGLKDIDDIVNGYLRGFPLQVEPIASGTYKDFQHHQRLTLIEIYTRNPTLAQAIVRERVGMLHGSSTISLPGVLDDRHGGLRTTNYLDQHDIPRPRSEEGASHATPQFPHINSTAVSFVSWFDPSGDALGYSGTGNRLDRRMPRDSQYYKRSLKNLQKKLKEAKRQKSASNEETLRKEREIERLQSQIKNEKTIKDAIEATPNDPLTKLMIANAPVMYLVAADVAIRAHKTDPTQPSNIQGLGAGGKNGEFAIRNGVKRDAIKIILVPDKYVKVLQDAIQQKGLNIAVFPLEDYAG